MSKIASLKKHANRFALLGVAETIGGAVAGNNTMLYSGIHNVADGGIFHAREHAHVADTAHNHAKARRGRRWAAAAMLAIGVGLGVREATLSESKSDDTELLYALTAADIAINAIALADLVRNRGGTGAHSDALTHLVIDASGTVFTIAGVVGANFSPHYDQVGALGHAGLLVVAAGMTWHHTRHEAPHDHNCHDA